MFRKNIGTKSVDAKNQKKIIYLILSKLTYFPQLIFCFLLINSSSTVAETKQKVIGVSIALSGPLGAIGTTLRNAITLAERQYDSKDLVRFIFEDDGFQPKNTVTIANKFLDQDKVDAVIVFGASTSMSVSPITEKRRIPLIGLTVLETLEEGKKNTFRFFVSTKEMNDLTVTEMQRRGYKKVAVVATMQDGTLKQRDHFLESSTLPIVLQEELLPGDLDFRSIATRIKASAADSVYIIALPPQGSTFAKQLRQIGYTGAIASSLQIGSPAEIKNGGEALKGVWFVSGDDSNANDFFAAYSKMFPDSPAFSETVYSYDLAKLLIQAAETEDISHYLHNIKDFSGALGKYGSNGKGSFNFGVKVKEIQ